MRIIVKQIPEEGLYLKEQIRPEELDLDTDLIKLRSPVNVEGRVTRITNALTVELDVRADFSVECSRCLKEFEWAVEKNLQLNYPLQASDVFIELNPDIREER